MQILHARSFHWICVANTQRNKTDNSYCPIYNSLTNGSAPLDVSKKIADFSYCESVEIIVGTFPVQQQTNCVDCGLFGIAFATSLAHNENPVRRVYDTAKLRQHLVSCLEAGKMSVFPSHSTQMNKRQATLNAIEIYYSCRMPYDNASEGDDMIEYTKCCA